MAPAFEVAEKRREGIGRDRVEREKEKEKAEVGRGLVEREEVGEEDRDASKTSSSSDSSWFDFEGTPVNQTRLGANKD
ncbi:hypothetical protein ACLB2K_067918 [Fragaria x ananassa]